MTMTWNRIDERKPNHNETVLARSHKGYCVCVYVDSRHMNEDLAKRGYLHECVDLEKNPYYFASQEIHRHTLNGVTHWLRLPETIED